jgi:lipid-binding SYLF domain-containing protein
MGMRTMTWLLLAGLAASMPVQSDEHEQLEKAATVLEEVLGIPDNVPADVLNRAECVIVLPSVVKFAFGFGGSYGRGVMTCRSGEDFTGPWGAPGMMRLVGGSFGLQLGGQSTDFVLFVMNPRGVGAVLSSQVKLGADVSAAAGPKGRDLSAATDATMRAEILSYSRSRGLFAGVSLEGSTLRADRDANERLYGSEIEPRDIVRDSRTDSPAAARDLLTILNTKSPTNRSGVLPHPSSRPKSDD